VLSLLLTAIIWNLGTWYYGIPCSSSHTLIGSMLGVGLAFSFLSDEPSVNYVNWSKAGDIGLSLLFSPILGFGLSIILMFILRQVVRKKAIFKEPNTNAPPPTWIRSVLLVTCTSVSFSHGSNDGQKGVGLLMLILIAIVPARFALDHELNIADYRKNVEHVGYILNKVELSQLNKSDSFEFAKVNSYIQELNKDLKGHETLAEFPVTEQYRIRKDVIMIGKSSKKLLSSPDINLSKNDKELLNYRIKEVKHITDFAPNWVILLISLSLGLGTMIGWKRIVKTIGEKIGKQHLTYAQGASSELVAAGTIGISTWLGLPVSTTQVLSSGIVAWLQVGASKTYKQIPFVPFLSHGYSHFL
jgi:PiT family inorganic phosphate transporter